MLAIGPGDARSSRSRVCSSKARNRSLSAVTCVISAAQRSSRLRSRWSSRSGMTLSTDWDASLLARVNNGYLQAHTARLRTHVPFSLACETGQFAELARFPSRKWNYGPTAGSPPQPAPAT